MGSDNSQIPAAIEEKPAETAFIRKTVLLKGHSMVSDRDMTAEDMEMLAIARELADRIGKLLEKAVKDGEKTEEEIFSTLYFPVIPETDPPSFNTFYDDYTDKVITPVEDEYLAKEPRLLYAALVDVNGYVPSHNSKFSRPVTGSPETDNKYHRTKRIFNDMAGLLAARNTGPFLLQSYPRDTGETVADVSVPVWVQGRHWGAVRCGYKRER